MKLWLLWRDDGYEGETLVGVYTTPENARTVMEERREPDDYIREWDADDRMDWRNRPEFTVWIDRGTGVVLDRHRGDEWLPPEGSSRKMPRSIVAVGAGGAARYIPASAAVSNVSFEDAERLAREALAEYRSES